MEIEILKRAITDQRNDIERKFRDEQIIERENKEYVKKFLNHPNILAILGVRRCGKSVFSMILSKQFKESVGYINFDDERLMGIKAEELNNIIQAFYELYGEVNIVIFDEIQNINGWELFVNRLRTTKKVIITGSDSNLLNGELSTHLTGRYIDFTLYPFSFRESLNFVPNIYLTKDIAKLRNNFNKYVNGSGFPEFEKFGSEIIVRIYEDIITKDCIGRYDIRNKETFREMARYLVSNFSCEFTYSKISKIFGIRDQHTTKNYVSYIKNAFLIVVLERYSPKLKQQIIAPKKVYAIDHGFCNFVSFNLSKNMGKIFENIVCIELLRRKSINNRIEVYYWKSAQQEEVDFVVKQGLKVVQLIQVCYDISSHNTKDREIKSLIKASNELKCNNLLLITEDKERKEKIKGKNINYTPLRKWLLNNKEVK